jgi:hypothetical protein
MRRDCLWNALKANCLSFTRFGKTASMLDYAARHALAAVVREGSFERAARALHVTPSAISQRVRLLELPLIQSHVSVVQWYDWFGRFTKLCAPDRFALRSFSWTGRTSAQR